MDPCDRRADGQCGFDRFNWGNHRNQQRYRQEDAWSRNIYWFEKFNSIQLYLFTVSKNVHFNGSAEFQTDDRLLMFRLLTDRKRNRSLRGGSNMEQQHVQTNCKRFCISVCGVALWDGLQENPPSCMSEGKLKKMYKQMFCLGSAGRRPTLRGGGGFLCLVHFEVLYRLHLVSFSASIWLVWVYFYLFLFFIFLFCFAIYFYGEVEFMTRVPTEGRWSTWILSSLSWWWSSEWWRGAPASSCSLSATVMMLSGSDYFLFTVSYNVF